MCVYFMYDFNNRLIIGYITWIHAACRPYNRVAIWPVSRTAILL